MKKCLLLAFTILSVIASCTHGSVQPNSSGNNSTDTSGNSGNPCSADTVYFKNDILPVILSNCTMSGCHNSTDHADGITLVDYNSIKSDGEVSPFNPNSSDLYEVLIETDVDKRMPYNLPPLSGTTIAKVKKWIEQGALNNACTDCDTTGTMSYSSHVNAIMQANCVGCHNANNASAGVDVSNYNGLFALVGNNKLLGTIKHETGYPAMPKNGSKLSDCNIAKIEKWINNGAPNN